MKLHWSPRSPFVRKVMVLAHEAGLAERLALVRTQVAMTEPNVPLLDDNPLGKIPTLVLDDGDVHLREGDVIVQQATNHAWVNRGTAPCRILFVLMDSKEP